ncbi:DUF488 domain-containing protein [Sinomonas sp. B1-1]|uniref:DUF488 domain-containing protein n=1 Tax=Sinomonas sp. B1-1 TaxID=3141454 RepID=UPI003D2BE6D8
MGSISIRRVYEPPATGARRILVDRVWPRGLSKEDAAVDLWLREVGPSTELRKWFNHDPERFEEFARRYRDELAGSEAYARLVEEARTHDDVELAYSAKDTEHNQAVVLLELLGEESL